jgi:hypothetical protein
MNTLKWRSLCFNFDGKQVKQIEDNLDITVTVDKIAISVTSPRQRGTLQRQFHLYIPFLGIARPQLQFPFMCL